MQTRKKKIYHRYIQMIMEAHKERITTPDNVLCLLLIQYKQTIDLGLFKKRKIDHIIFINNLIKLKDSKEFGDYIITVIRHLKAYHSNMHPDDDFAIMFSAFFSVYEIYQAYLTPDIDNILMLRDIWNEMITQWVNTAIDSVRTYRKQWREFKRDNKLAPIYAFNEKYPTANELMNTSILLNHLQPWIPLRNNDALLNLALESHRNDKDPDKIYYLVNYKHLFSQEQKNIIINTLLIKFSNKDIEPKYLLDVFYHFRDDIPPEHLSTIKDEFTHIILETPHSMLHYKEWVPTNSFNEIIDTNIDQMSDKNTAASAFYYLAEFKQYIPKEKVSPIIDTVITYADANPDVSDDLRINAFLFFYNIRSIIPIIKYNAIIALFSKFMFEHDVSSQSYLFNFLNNFLNNLHPLMSKEYVAIFINTFCDKLFDLINHDKIKGNKNEILCNTHYIQLMLQYFSNEQFSKLLSNIDDAIVKHSKHTLFYCNIIFIINNRIKMAPHLCHQFATYLMNLLPRLQSNDKARMYITAKLYEYADYFTEDKRQQLINDLFQYIQSDDIDQLRSHYHLGPHLIKWMTNDQKTSFTAHVIELINKLLTKCSDLTSDDYYRSDGFEDFFEELITYALPEMTNEQYTNVINDLLYLTQIWTDAKSCLCFMLKMSHSVEHKTALLCHYMNKANSGDHKMKDFFIEIYTSYRNDVANVLINHSFHQETSYEIPEELSQEFRRHVC